MSKSGGPPREEEVEEEAMERLPRWRRELLRIRDRARAREEDLRRRGRTKE